MNNHCRRKMVSVFLLMVWLVCLSITAEAAIQCYECHGSKDSRDYRPVDAPYRNITSGGFEGNHRAHVDKSTDFSECARCHPGSASFNSSHRDGMIKLSANINASPLEARYKNATSAFLQTANPILGTCTNVNCHFERITPTWGGPRLAYLADCNVCHGAPPSGGETGNAGSHARHNDYYGGVDNCKKCHADHSTFSHATSVGRNLVVTPRDPANVPAGSYSGPLDNYLPSQSKTFGNCVNTYCHSDGSSVATGVVPANASAQWGTTQTCGSCHSVPPAYANGSSKANSHQVPEHAPWSCNKCHAGTTSDGLTITNPAVHANGAYDVSPASPELFTGYSYSSTGGTCTNVGCHFNNASRQWGTTLACNACHDSPPTTPAHLKHFGGTLANAAYGDVRIAQDFGANAAAYIMNCGNCHPMDGSRHRNGTVEVELYNPSAPDGSLKKKNPPAASYTPGTDILIDSRGFGYTKGACNNIYCHSYNDWTTPGGVPQSSDCSSYIPSNLVTTRIYKSVTWESGPLSCSGCHGLAPRSSLPDNDGGSGNSHAWIDGDGYENLHNYNMGFDPISCSYCHNDTVKTINSWTRDAKFVATLGDVPVANFAKHVNGTVDVAFDKVNSFPYNTPYSLSSATYDTSTKTCSNVSCHKGQTSVKWGTPYRYYYEIECDRCHKYGYCP